MNSGDYPTPAAPAPAARPLTPRQERFCHAYVACPNAADAARAAGYSKAWARKQGWRLLRSTRIRDRLLAIQTELAQDLKDSLDALVGKLEVVYRLAVQDRRTLAAVRAVELQGRLIQLKRRLPPAAEEAAAALRAGIERRRAMGAALARRPASSPDAHRRRRDDPRMFNPDA